MTIKKPGLALLVAFVSVFGLSQTASADMEDCEDYIEDLQDFVEDDLCSYSKMCKGLSHKLDNALHKLEQGKTDHALRRLEDFRATLDSMSEVKEKKKSRKSKMAIDLGMYNEMRPYIAKAMMCIDNGGMVDDGPGTGDTPPPLPPEGPNIIAF